MIFLEKVVKLINNNIEAINRQLKQLFECDSLEDYRKVLYGDESNQKETPGVRSFWSLPFVEYIVTKNYIKA